MYDQSRLRCHYSSRLSRRCCAGGFQCVAGREQHSGRIVGTVSTRPEPPFRVQRFRVLNTRTGVPRETVTEEQRKLRGGFADPGCVQRRSHGAELSDADAGESSSGSRRTLNLTFRLTVGQVTETVNVQAEAELLKSTEGVISTTIDNTKVVELPLNGRNFNNLVRLTPGATRGTSGAAKP